MKTSIRNLFVLNLILRATFANANVSVLPKATVLCPVNEDSGVLHWAYGEFQFPDGLEFYGPKRNKIEGSMSFRLHPAKERSPAVNAVLTGNLIRGEHFDSPDYWLFSGSTETGEEIHLYLDQNHRDQSFAYGEIYFAGQKLQAKCEVTLTLPTTKSPPKHCNPRAC